MNEEVVIVKCKKEMGGGWDRGGGGQGESEQKIEVFVKIQNINSGGGGGSGGATFYTPFSLWHTTDGTICRSHHSLCSNRHLLLAGFTHFVLVAPATLALRACFFVFGSCSLTECFH